VFLPGAAGARDFWRPVSDRLPNAWIKTLHSWPGAGREPHDPRVQSFRDLIARVASETDDQSDLVAQSMGGIVAIGVALRDPRKIRRLVLVATSGGLDVGTPWRRRLARPVPGRVSKRRALDLAGTSGLQQPTPEDPHCEADQQTPPRRSILSMRRGPSRSCPDPRIYPAPRTAGLPPPDGIQDQFHDRRVLTGAHDHIGHSVGAGADEPFGDGAVGRSGLGGRELRDRFAHGIISTAARRGGCLRRKGATTRHRSGRNGAPACGQSQQSLSALGDDAGSCSGYAARSH
jgi:pimeloyl-ACP methyl ester carboxylesterase